MTSASWRCIMSFWIDFGFSGNPYATAPIPPTEQGKKLLVGRDREVESLISRLRSSARHPTIEGNFGVGKTSMISVACYQLQRDFELGRAGRSPLIPLREPFQLTKHQTIEDFHNDLFCKVAEAFRENRHRLEATGRRVPRNKDIDRWINQAIYGSRTIGVTSPLGGATVARGSAPTSSPVYERYGFPRAMKELLKSCFPGQEYGGFVGVVDNLELMRTSENVREIMEVMRDTVFSQAGLRWIFCGAQGSVRSAAATPRLRGHLASPVEVNPISDDLMGDVIDRRIEAYKIKSDPIIPVGPGGFWLLYDIFDRNLRIALSFAEEFAFFLYEQNGKSANSEDFGLLETWLAETADRDCEAADQRLGPREWTTFDYLTLREGTCRPCNDFAEFEFHSASEMRSTIKFLKDANLVSYETDEMDKRRKVVHFTPTGWLVAYVRAGYSPPNYLLEHSHS
ncbi:hypothetical protein ACFWSF_08440 [Streptomyces sp. NPDC058611]|uniref:hypothetical protein n=1 Tax=unclassified Streptomyces TaxID=2593676 RepID=UPI00364DB26F